MKQLNAKELKTSLNGFKLSGIILERMQGYCKGDDVSINKLDSIIKEVSMDFLVVFDKYDFDKKTSPAIFKSTDSMDLEDSDEYNSLFLYYDGKKYYKITPKITSADAKKTEVKKEDSK